MKKIQEIMSEEMKNRYGTVGSDLVAGPEAEKAPWS